MKPAPKRSGIRWLPRLLVALVMLLPSGLLSAGPDDDDPFKPLNRPPAKVEPPKEEPKNEPAPKTEPGKDTPASGKEVIQGRAPSTSDRISFVVTATPAVVGRGQLFTVTIKATPKPGFHTYPVLQHEPKMDADMLNKIRFEPAPGLTLVPPMREEPAPELVKDGSLQYLEYKSTVNWSQDFLVTAEAKPGPVTVRFSINLQVCDRTCVRGVHRFEVTVNVSDAAPVAVPPEITARLPKPSNNTPAGTGTSSTEKKKASLLINADSPKEYKGEVDAMLAQIKAGGSLVAAETKSDGSSDLMAFVLAGIFWGAVSLITPCVFPMIPITVSYFLKQSEKEHHRPLTMALVYCATIIVVLTIAAVTLLSFFRYLSVNPIMNYALGALFIFFALSLFGMYEIELPSGLARFTSAREGKGGLIGTMFMALTFTIISFACVAPFLGGFGGTSASSSMTWSHRIFGGLAFSMTFASPFFILALFPTLLKKMPKSGNWLNNVKVVMGFLELAAALKFFRAAEIVLLPKPVFFTFDFSLGILIVLAFMCGLYLLGTYKLPLDTTVEHLSVPRLLFSIVFLSLGLYLVPALFRTGSEGASQRPNGVLYAWIDSFLLPEPQADLAWSGDLKQAVEEARASRRETGEPKYVFVDFTGKSCVNCKFNEREVFSKGEMKELFKPYQLVQIYTDVVPNEFYAPSVRSRFGGGVARQEEDALVNLAFQREAFNNEQLPLYVILEPMLDGKIKVVGVYTEGKINDEGKFADFLRLPQELPATAKAGK